MVAWIKIKSAVLFKSLRDGHDEVKKSFMLEIIQVKGIVPLLMKRKNDQRWSPSDREELRRYLRRLSRLSPYFFFLVIPGSFMFLPFFVWWLRWRRKGSAYERNQQVIQQIIIENEIKENNGVEIKIVSVEQNIPVVVISQPEENSTISKSI